MKVGSNRVIFLIAAIGWWLQQVVVVGDEGVGFSSTTGEAVGIGSDVLFETTPSSSLPSRDMEAEATNSIDKAAKEERKKKAGVVGTAISSKPEEDEADVMQGYEEDDVMSGFHGDEEEEEEEDDEEIERLLLLEDLNEHNNDWYIPNNDEFLQLVLNKIQYHNETYNMDSKGDVIGDVIRGVVRKLIKKHPGDDVWLKMVQTELEDDFEAMYTDGTPSRAAIELALAKASGGNQCSLRGRCETKNDLVGVKNFIKTMLDQDISDGKAPNYDNIVIKLKEEYGMGPEEALDLINSNPSIKGYIASKLVKTEQQAYKNSIRKEADELAQQLEVLGNNGTDFDDALKEINMTQEDALKLISVMDKKQTKNVKEALQKPQQEMAAQVEAGVRRLMAEDHTYFVEDDEPDEDEQRRLQVLEGSLFDGNKNSQHSGNLTTIQEGRLRKLKFVPHPSKTSFSDHVKRIENEYQEKRARRKLSSRKSVTEDISNFARLLTSHTKQIRAHARHLKEACKEGTLCDVDRLEEIAIDLDETGTSVSETLDPFSKVFDQIATSQTAVDTVDMIMKIVIAAVTVGAAIPFPPTSGVLTTIGTLLKGIHTGIKVIDKGLTRFEKTAGRAWDNSVEKIKGMIESYDVSIFSSITEGAKIVMQVASSDCTKALAGKGMIGFVEDGIGTISNYVHRLYNALKGLLSALKSEALGGFSKALSFVLSPIDKIKKGLSVFDPLKNLLQREFTIKPWIAIPSKQKYLGYAKCLSGYSPDKTVAGFGPTCWENGSHKWEVGVTGYKMLRKCNTASSPMDGHIAPDRCRRKRYFPGRGVPRIKWFAKAYCPWHNYELRGANCVQRCNSGYHVELGTCVSNCARGWSRGFDGSCLKPQRSRNKSTKTCDSFKYKLDHGRSMEFKSTMGECWQRCKSRETSKLTFCWPEAQLKFKIQDIFDAFDKMLDYAMNNPLVSKIKGWIDDIINKWLKPLADKIMNKVNGGLKSVGLPELDIEGAIKQMKSFNVFQSLGINMPAAPDFAQIANTPQKAYKTFLQELPSPIRNIERCSIDDVTCMVNQVIGAENVISFKEKINLMLPPFNAITKRRDLLLSEPAGEAAMPETIEELKSLIGEIVLGVKCEWGSKSVPVSDVLAKAGLPDANTCDMPLKYCQSVDTKDVEEQVQAVTRMLEAYFLPIVKQLAPGDSKHDNSKHDDLWIPIYGVSFKPRVLSQWRIPVAISNFFEKELNWKVIMNKAQPQETKTKKKKKKNRQLKKRRSSYRKRKGTGKDKNKEDTAISEPKGVRFVSENNFLMNFGLRRRDGIWGVGMELGARIEAKVLDPFQSTQGLVAQLLEAPALLQDSLGTSTEYRMCYPTGEKEPPQKVSKLKKRTRKPTKAPTAPPRKRPSNPKNKRHPAKKNHRPTKGAKPSTARPKKHLSNPKNKGRPTKGGMMNRRPTKGAKPSTARPRKHPPNPKNMGRPTKGARKKRLPKEGASKNRRPTKGARRKRRPAKKPKKKPQTEQSEESGEQLEDDGNNELPPEETWAPTDETSAPTDYETWAPTDYYDSNETWAPTDFGTSAPTEGYEETSAPTEPYEDDKARKVAPTYTFPPTKTEKFVHGLCVMGADDVKTRSSDSDLTYTLVPNFQDGVKLWSNRNYVVQGIQGAKMCEGGLYLRPSLHKTVDKNTGISVTAKSDRGNLVTVCALVETSNDRDGDWNEALISDGFSVSDEFRWSGGKVSAKMRCYCKPLSGGQNSLIMDETSAPTEPYEDDQARKLAPAEETLAHIEHYDYDYERKLAPSGIFNVGSRKFNPTIEGLNAPCASKMQPLVTNLTAAATKPPQGCSKIAMQELHHKLGRSKEVDPKLAQQASVCADFWFAHLSKIDTVKQEFAKVAHAGLKGLKKPEVLSEFSMSYLTDRVMFQSEGLANLMLIPQLEKTGMKVKRGVSWFGGKFSPDVSFGFGFENEFTSLMLQMSSEMEFSGLQLGEFPLSKNGLKDDYPLTTGVILSAKLSGVVDLGNFAGQGLLDDKV